MTALENSRITETHEIEKRVQAVQKAFEAYLSEGFESTITPPDMKRIQEVERDVRWLAATLNSTVLELREVLKDCDALSLTLQDRDATTEKETAFLKQLEYLLQIGRGMDGKDAHGVVVLVRQMILDHLDPNFGIPF